MSESIVYLDRPGVLVMPGVKGGGTRIPIYSGALVAERTSQEYMGNMSYEFSIVMMEGAGKTVTVTGSDEPTKLLVLEVNGSELNEDSRVVDLSELRKWVLSAEMRDIYSMRLDAEGNMFPETYSNYLKRRLKD